MTVLRRAGVRVVTALAATTTCMVPFATSPAQAADTSVAPGEDAIHFELPQRWNDDYKPGTACSTPGDTGANVTARDRWFKQTDAASVANHDSVDMPVTQTVTQTREQTFKVSAKVKGEGELAKIMTNTFGFTYVHEVHWKLNQKVGPYTLPAGQQGRLAWGFIVLEAEGQNVRCTPDLVWKQSGKPYHISAPETKYAELQIDQAPHYNN